VKHRTCRGCGVTLTLDNARVYRGRWVGACRACESLAGSARARRHREQRRRERFAERELVEFALEVLAIGGNGEGWTLADAVNALRIATGQDGVNDQWIEPVGDDDRRRLRAFVGLRGPVSERDER